MNLVELEDLEEDCVGKIKDAYYFPHDSNARNDPNILAMRSVYGWQGYGWYWMLIEMMREQSDYRLPLNKYMIDALAMQMQCDRNAAQKFIDDCVKEFQLLASDGSFLWSESLLRRMAKYDEKSEKARASAQVRWGKSECNANAMQTQCDGNASKVEESIVDQSILTTIATTEIEETLRILQTIPGYPTDSVENRKHISDVKVDYPTVHLPTEAKKFKDWIRDHPIKKKANPRLRFRNWCENAQKYAEKRGERPGNTRQHSRQDDENDDWLIQK